jgi:hypothetical protein
MFALARNGGFAVLAKSLVTTVSNDDRFGAGRLSGCVNDASRCTAPPEEMRWVAGTARCSLCHGVAFSCISKGGWQYRSSLAPNTSRAAGSVSEEVFCSQQYELYLDVCWKCSWPRLEMTLQRAFHAASWEDPWRRSVPVTTASLSRQLEVYYASSPIRYSLHHHFPR